MGSKKRQPSAVQESYEGEINKNNTPKYDMEIHKEKINEDKGSFAPQAALQSLKPMERKKKRKVMDKERHRFEFEAKEPSKAKNTGENVSVPQMQLSSPLKSDLPGFHIDVFRNLASADSSVREAAAEKLVIELVEVQRAYEQLTDAKDEENSQLEAEKDDGLDGCAPSLRYAIRRLIRGVSSSRECARQGFSLGLAIVVEMIPAVKLVPVMKLIINLLEVSSAMKGLEARDCYLGCLFAYGSLARSHRLATEWISDKNTPVLKEFTSTVISLAQKKRYLHEPAVAIILDMLEKLPIEAIKNHVVVAPGVHEWLQKALETGNPDALFFALKLQERVSLGRETFGELLPHPFNAENFFSGENLQHLERCFKESTFCLPRLHSIWQVLVNMLIPEARSQIDVEMHCSIKNKKSRKCSSQEDIIKNIRCFCEVVIEGTLLQSSHDRKHLALNILQLLLPRLPTSCINSVLSHKLIYCLMDILSTKSSWLYNAAQLFMKELICWTNLENERCAAVIVSLQKYSNGRFDCITRTDTVKTLVQKFTTSQGSLHFVHNLMSLFVDEAAITDEPSDQSHTTDENSEMGSVEDKGSPGASGNTDHLKNWVIDCMPRVLKNLKAGVKLGISTQTEIQNFMEEKFKVQTEIVKFLAVQGLFSASLGTEVTSFELQEKFKWPKIASSSSLCKMCIEQLQLLLEDAQKEETGGSVNNLELNDLGSYFMCFLKTLCSIPSVSLFRTLSNEDKRAFNKLLAIESRLYQKERNVGPGLVANKLHAMRYLVIQLVLQILLYPDDFSEAALDFVACCKKVFPSTENSDSSEEEDAFDDNDMPELMDVLVETLLSILPRSSGRMCYVVEQVFRFFCSDITDYGLQRMLRVVKKDLKPLRHPVSSDGDDDDDDEDDDVLGIEDIDEMEEVKADEMSVGEEHKDDSKEMENGGETTSSNGDESDEAEVAGVECKENIHRSSRDEPCKIVKAVGDEDDDAKSEASDDSDGGMDDDAMFRLDAYHAQLLKERTGNDNAFSQLILFKLRVLSLLEIYVQKYPGKSHVLAIYSCLVQAYSKYHGVGGNEQLGQRINGILQKKIIKGKDYPKDEDIPLDTLEKLLDKSLKTASRSRVKDISSLAQASAFWLLKIVNSRNFSELQLSSITQIFEGLLVDYFNNRNCRLKSGFIKEIIRRQHWLGLKLFRFLLGKCATTKSEFRRIEAVDMVDCIIKSVIPSSKVARDKEAISKSSKLLKAHLPELCDLIQQLLTNFPGKQSRRAEVRRFCTRILQAVSILNLKKSFRKAMKPEGISLCELHLGNTFLSFQAL
ncbi:myb-binding protein 1A [Phalaenopsis equestris]|uniref:myb-binding protein 1A n=1 Tax=Phalaenopsis equestris TaxID=78828 RepID=UPI0009E634F8|nr:myb-binding protein 1A [Phalaenopsis equestris]XP_020575488.1 myb-binding protein 1A [Phalaenopsis equestris]